MKKTYNTIAISALELQTANMICASIQGDPSTGIQSGGSSSKGGVTGGGVNARGTNGATTTIGMDPDFI